MPRCPETILEASQISHPRWENRLTAIFACVLDQHPELAGALFQRVGLPRGQRYEAYLEEWVTSSRRVDMRILAYDDTVLVSQLLSEHKRHGGRFSTRQREDYLNTLDDAGVPGRLTTIVGAIHENKDEKDDEDALDDGIAEEHVAVTDRAGRGDDDEAMRTVPEDADFPERPGQASSAEPRWIALSWQLIAELADSVGRDAAAPWGGPDWRVQAVQPEAPAKHRALCELIWYLEEEGYAVLEPFDVDHASTLARREATDRAVEALLQQASEAREMRPFVPVGRQADDGCGLSQRLEVSAGS